VSRARIRQTWRGEGDGGAAGQSAGGGYWWGGSRTTAKRLIPDGPKGAWGAVRRPRGAVDGNVEATKPSGRRPPEADQKARRGHGGGAGHSLPTSCARAGGSRRGARGGRAICACSGVCTTEGAVTSGDRALAEAAGLEPTQSAVPSGGHSNVQGGHGPGSRPASRASAGIHREFCRNRGAIAILPTGGSDGEASGEETLQGGQVVAPVRPRRDNARIGRGRTRSVASEPVVVTTAPRRRASGEKKKPIGGACAIGTKPRVRSVKDLGGGELVSGARSSKSEEPARGEFNRGSRPQSGRNKKTPVG